MKNKQLKLINILSNVQDMVINNNISTFVEIIQQLKNDYKTDNMETWVLFKLETPTLLVKSISEPPLTFTWTTDEISAMEFQTEEDARLVISTIGIDFIGTRPKGRPQK